MWTIDREKISMDSYFPDEFLTMKGKALIYNDKIPLFKQILDFFQSQ